MICFTTHNFIFFKRREIWFYNREKAIPAGYNVFAYTLEENVPPDALIEWTSHIDLKKNENQLYNSVSSTFKLHINRAIRSEINTIITFSPTIRDITKISKEIRIFAKHKNFAFSKRRLFSLQKTGNICISMANIKNINIVTHVFLFDERRIVLLHTFHNMKFEKDRIRSYANKLLHWKDILEFKRRNFELFDWGGINPENLPGITQFKLSFGGKTEKCFSYIKVTPLLLLFFKLYKKIRK